MNQRPRNFARHLYTLGLLLGGAFFVWQVWRVVAALIEAPVHLERPWLIGLALLGVVFATVAQVGAWRAIMAGLGYGLSWAVSQRVSALPFVARYIPGTIWGYLSRSHMLATEQGVPSGIANLSAVVEAAGFVTASSIMTAAVGVLVFDGFLFLAGVGGVGLSGLGILIAQWLATRGPAVDRLVSPVGGRDVIAGVTLQNVSIAVPWQLCHWAGYGIALWAIAGMLSVRQISEVPDVTAAYSLAWLVGFLLLFVPAGLGLREWVLTLLLVRALGMPASLAAMSALLMRAFLVGVELGSIVFALMLARLAPHVRGVAGTSIKDQATMTQNWFARIWGLWRVSVKRARSEQDYLEFQSYQAEWLIDYLTKQGVNLAGKRMLDIGSGVGGYSISFLKAGAHVTSVDLVQPKRPEGKDLLLNQVRGDALRVPLRAESFDFVFCASLIEHVREPQVLLEGIKRLLKPGGVAYVSFPPYYSPMGGHEFAPFHYLGEKAALRIVSRRHVLAGWVQTFYSARGEPASFEDLYAGWGLYRMTIRKMRSLIPRVGFVCEDLSTRYLPVSAIRWPLLGEILTWHAQFLLRKPETAICGSTV